MQGQFDLLWLREWLQISDLHNRKAALNTENASTNNGDCAVRAYHCINNWNEKEAK